MEGETGMREENGKNVVIATTVDPTSAHWGRYMMQRTRSSPWEEVECRFAKGGRETRLGDGETECGWWSCEDGVWEPQNEAAIHSVTVFREEAGRLIKKRGQEQNVCHAGARIGASDRNEAPNNFPGGVTAYPGEQVASLAARAITHRDRSRSFVNEVNRHRRREKAAASRDEERTAKATAPDFSTQQTHQCTDSCMRSDKLLDLDDDEVVVAYGQPYVALGYVWSQWKPELMTAVRGAVVSECQHL